MNQTGKRECIRYSRDKLLQIRERQNDSHFSEGDNRVWQKGSKPGDERSWVQEGTQFNSQKHFSTQFSRDQVSSSKGDVLPSNWIVETRQRKSGVKEGGNYKVNTSMFASTHLSQCYIDPVTSRKFYSMPEVMRYLSGSNNKDSSDIELKEKIAIILAEAHNEKCSSKDALIRLAVMLGNDITVDASALVVPMDVNAQLARLIQKVMRGELSPQEAATLIDIALQGGNEILEDEDVIIAAQILMAFPR